VYLDPHPHVHACLQGTLVSERQSVRRQVQLIADWLEAAVSRLLQQNAQQVRVAHGGCCLLDVAAARAASEGC